VPRCSPTPGNWPWSKSTFQEWSPAAGRKCGAFGLGERLVRNSRAPSNRVFENVKYRHPPTATWTPSASYNRRIGPSLRGPWRIMVARDHHDRRVGQSRAETVASCWSRNRIAGLVGRTEWKDIPCNDDQIRLLRQQVVHHPAERLGHVGLALISPRASAGRIGRNPRCRSARCASFTVSIRVVGDRVERRHGFARGGRNGGDPAA